MSLSSHHTRLLTAVGMAACLAAALFFGGWFLFAMGLVFSSLALNEFYSMFWPGWRRLPVKAAGAAVCAALLYASFVGRPELGYAILLGAFWAACCTFLVRYSRAGDQGGIEFPRAMIFPAGLLYIPMALQFLFAFHSAEIVFVMLATFATDTGGYYAGSMWGKRKVWPSVSPKKTWMGSLGGLAACTALCLGYGMALGQAPWWVWLAIAPVLNVAAQFGDFVESALKRSLGVKDAGSILPGHGGVLDRIDGLLLAVPVYAAARSLYPLF